MRHFIFFLGTVFIFTQLQAQLPTMGLIQHSPGSADNGYVLFSPIGSTSTFLIDKCGKHIHTWTAIVRPAQSVYLLPDGTLLRPGKTANTVFTTGGQGGRFARFDWNSTLLWTYTISTTTECQHHDIEYLPNGNILALVWELKTPAEAIAAGRNPVLIGPSLWSEKVVELEPTGTNTANIVWEWKVWDHLIQDLDSTKSNFGVVGDHPELINLNFGATVAADWIHNNAIHYNPLLDQILITAHNFDEIWLVDHSTTTAEAASHTGGNSGKGGDLLYRWGNPAAYNHGDATDQKFYGMHDARWIETGLPNAGKIMIFNNGNDRPDGFYSTVEIITPPVDSNGVYQQTLPYLPLAPDWIYQDPIPTNFFSNNISGAHQLANGNVLICSGQSGIFFEVAPDDSIVWKYINPIANTGPMTQGTTPSQNSVFRATFYPSSYAGFSGQTLTPGDPLELNPLPYICDLTTGIQWGETGVQPAIYPNPAREYIQIEPGTHDFHIQVFSVDGRKIMECNACTTLHTQDWKPGMYVLHIIIPGKETLHKKVLITR